MPTETVAKKKETEEEIPDVIEQLEASIKDLEEGRVYRVR